ncbi:Cof-type HAD-IIB family hydrolase [Companilactobacillus alimentarius]|uniref:Haloacid dehalogenase n=1 Tax=Companilactobacillus alimentarius DSM 20249 TaxID=1423720 RepID=A0A2K9HGZ8_9LACO|nr:Cof-type HAD-IIB family hydrolase [Companilactobacillus alimentarius]AUI71056.1 haloacid dehalogenase [Companilactobacillus alimentarius DSM 20249]KRK75173.1 HAD superfamily hydrolase [Companilactobacillus alimentarius DSM 20249]MDT6951689.1 Cof-type HAD-IIB family hydrolase [Companilactobacillus alimentarius]GEO44051.1 hydrolase [Companilactobacillus alimentarius]
MSYKLIALDMDDTLLTSEKTISKKNQTMIKQALKQGIKVVLCSGRTHNAITNYIKILGISGPDQYMITNGGGIIENMEGKIIYHDTLSNAFYREFVDFIKKNQLHYNVVDSQGNTYTSHVEWIDKYTITQAFENENGLYIREPEELPDDFEIVKAIINGEAKQLDEISDMVHEHFDQNYFVVRTGVGFLEIFPKNVNKGEAVKHLAGQLGIDLKEVMAMGDRDNDIPMIKIAGKGVAMDNATSGAKKVSDYVTADNNHDGVGLAIEKFAL